MAYAIWLNSHTHPPLSWGCRQPCSNLTNTRWERPDRSPSVLPPRRPRCLWAQYLPCLRLEVAFPLTRWPGKLFSSPRVIPGCFPAPPPALTQRAWTRASPHPPPAPQAGSCLPSTSLGVPALFRVTYSRLPHTPF